MIQTDLKKLLRVKHRGRGKWEPVRDVEERL